MPQYFSTDPAARTRPRRVTLALADLSIDLDTDAGVFSAERIDPGTRVLLATVPTPREGATVLDLGCGYGPIACTAAIRASGGTVWAVDVNARARDLAAHNATALGLPHVTVCAPDEVPPELTFDAIWSNPPIRIGKTALHDLLTHWLHRLTPRTGRAWLVVQRHLGSDSLAEWLVSQGWRVARRASRQGYRVLEVGDDESDVH